LVCLLAQPASLLGCDVGDPRRQRKWRHLQTLVAQLRHGVAHFAMIPAFKSLIANGITHDCVPVPRKNSKRSFRARAPSEDVKASLGARARKHYGLSVTLGGGKLALCRVTSTRPLAPATSR